MKSQPEDFIIQTRQVPALMRWRDRLLTLCLWILVGAWLVHFIMRGAEQVAFYEGLHLDDPGLLRTLRCRVALGRPACRHGHRV